MDYFKTGHDGLGRGGACLGESAANWPTHRTLTPPSPPHISDKFYLISDGNDTQRLCASQHPSLIHVICADVRKLEGRSSSYLKEIKQLTWAQFAGNRILYFVGNIFKEFVLTRVNCCTGCLCHLLVNTLNCDDCDHTGLELLETWRGTGLSCEQKRWVFAVLIYFCVFTMNGFYVMFAKEGDKWAVKNLFEDVRAPSELLAITKHWVT